MVVDEDEETITEVKCHDCAASQGGCKHALAFLMWMCDENSKPSPTQVDSYWKKPRLSRISVNAVLQTKDFGVVQCKSDVDVKKFFTTATSPKAALSSLQRYTTAVDEVSCLDMHQLCIGYLANKDDGDPASASDFREYCKLIMTDKACNNAFEKTKDQADSRHWHLIRYARISASNIYNAAHNKKSTGGVLKEMILGASTLNLTRAMQRGQMLEKLVLEVVKNKMGITIKKVGIKLSNRYPEIGASPDGLSEEYVIEIKCPSNEKTFKNYVYKNDVVAPKFMAQMQLQMKMCNRPKALFCVAYPDFEKSQNVKILEVNFDPQLTDNLLAKAIAYWEKHIFPVLLASAGA